METDAIIIANMGGPSRVEEVPDYLRQIFRDPEILPVPSFLRNFVAERIVKARSGKVKERYRLIGGSSPLPHWTERLRITMEDALRTEGTAVRVLGAFRYTRPTLEDVVRTFPACGIRKFTLLPMFPHETSAMTGSVVQETHRVADALRIPFAVVPAWGNREEILELWRENLRQAMADAGTEASVLFVAHGIPLRNVKRGDLYLAEVEQTVRALSAIVPQSTRWSLAYQSKVGPIRWTRPYMEEELDRVCRRDHPLVIMPLSFAADCLETLYDLDIVAAQRATKLGVSRIVRVPAFNDDPRFARALVSLLQKEDHVLVN